MKAMHCNNAHDVRDEFAWLLSDKQFTSVIGAAFVADKEVLFGNLDTGYLKREEEWYDSMSLNVNDIPGGAPAVWKAVASTDGTINSNYGWACFSKENGSQFDKVVTELRKNPESRRAIIIYTRPSMWEEYNVDGRSDFMCTNAVQYLIRDGKVHAIVQMRSNDAVYGYKNDRFWQKTVLDRLAAKLELPAGDMYWNAGSLHVYERHFYLVDHFVKTGELSIKKERYVELYPSSPYGK